MKKSIAINGFGRIGRGFLRAALQHDELNVCYINDLADVSTLAHLFKYDSIHGRFGGDITVEGNSLIVNGSEVVVSSQRKLEDLNWEVDYVIECTGLYKTRSELQKHINNGSKQVILSAPAADETIKTIVLGVNDHVLEPNDNIVSNASCTTNSAAPLIKILHENLGVEQAYISTIHSYTSDQRLHDSPHKDLRRARAAATSIIPTTTGAAKAISKIFPDLEGAIGGCGIRVPVSNGSLTDLTCIIQKATSVEEVNEMFEKAAQNELKGILEFTDDPIVSVDIIGNPHSSIFDSGLTSVIGKMVKVVGWYDNETGYVNRLVDLVLKEG